MPKKSVSDLDFDFNAFGDLELTGFADGDEFEEEDILEDEEEEVEEVEEDEDVEELDEAPTVKSRLDGLERTIQALPQMISTAIASAINGGRQQKEQDDDEDIPDELDNKQMVNILAKRMQKAVKAEVTNAVKDMKDSDPDLRDARVTAEFQRCNAKYGQKFRDRMIPVAKIVQRSNYGISVEDAYLSISDMPVSSRQQPAKVSQKTGKVPKQVRVDADSDDAVGDINQQNQRPKLDIKKIKQISDADMFQHAWNGSLMQAARGARRRR